MRKARENSRKDSERSKLSELIVTFIYLTSNDKEKCL